MQFVRTAQYEVASTVVALLSQGLAAGHSVVWLISGGEGRTAERTVLRTLLRTHRSLLSRLVIVPTHEQYACDDAHTKPASTRGVMAELLKDMDDLGEATYINILSPHRSFEEMVELYGTLAQTILQRSTYIVGQFTLGPDGALGGLAPSSPALSITGRAVAGFRQGDHAYLTLTPDALTHCTHAVVSAYGRGHDMVPVLEKLQRHRAALETLPALLLYSVPEVYVFNTSSNRHILEHKRNDDILTVINKERTK